MTFVCSALGILPTIHTFPPMPKTKFSKVLSAKRAELKLSTAALAKAIGVGIQSVDFALKGKSAPNASTAAKYAAFLGVEVAEVKAMAGKKAVGKAEAKAEKAPKATKAAKAPKPAKAPKAKKSAQKAVETDRADFTDLTLGELLGVFSDPLVVAVANATAAQRKIIQAVLAS
jgi:DNA-binding XRE family transcriptional regulator